jgi:hypothetical protein
MGQPPGCPAKVPQTLAAALNVADWNLRDVGVAGSNPVTPTTDFKTYLSVSASLGVRLIGK